MGKFSVGDIVRLDDRHLEDIMGLGRVIEPDTGMLAEPSVRVRYFAGIGSDEAGIPQVESRLVLVADAADSLKQELCDSMLDAMARFWEEIDL